MVSKFMNSTPTSINTPLFYNIFVGNKSKKPKKCGKKAKKYANLLSTKLSPYFSFKKQLFPSFYTQPVENSYTHYFPGGLIMHNNVENKG